MRAKRLDRLVARLSAEELEILRQAVEDPDTIYRELRSSAAQSVEKKLTELNLIVDMWDRDPVAWIDEPPPEKDPELGIGRFYAWQTPLHREAVRKVLEGRVGA